MTSQYCAEAPGKLFLLGEYAVLDGSPAIVAAVEPKVRVVAGYKGTRQKLSIAIPSSRVHFTADVRSLPPTGPGPVAFVLACCASCPEEERRTVLPGLNLVIEFPRTQGVPAKLGLGGSAALVASVSALLFELAHGRGRAQQHKTEVFHRALAAHRAAQQGRGSGADVAASVFGGLILFEASNGSAPRVEPLPWPENLALATSWSGQPASTAELIGTYYNSVRDHAALHRQFLRSSALAVETFATAIRSCSDAESAWRAAAPVLLEFAPKLRLPYLTPALARILALAQSQNIVAKPSGAGGGDSAVALCRPDQKAALIELWERSGFPCPAVSPAKEGVVCG